MMIEKSQQGAGNQSSMRNNTMTTKQLQINFLRKDIEEELVESHEIVLIDGDSLGEAIKRVIDENHISASDFDYYTIKIELSK